MHRGVGEPFAIEGDGIALHGDIAALLEERLRGVAGVDREVLGAPGGEGADEVLLGGRLDGAGGAGAADKYALKL